MKDFFRIQKNFFHQSNELKSYFDKQFQNPRVAHENRFIWDYWYIEDQYKLIRTPAYHFFPEDIYQNLENKIIEWGKKNLGCHTISPPWLSYYIDGCYQNLHADNPHGPWAFVYSLTELEQSSLKGGETLLLNPNVLQYWEHFDPELGFESSDLVIKIPSPFNQLTVFDPRIPHGVNQVQGVHDPINARIVIHGWFLEPSPFIEGPLQEDDMENALNEQLPKILENLQTYARTSGSLTSRLKISSEGNVTECICLFNNLTAADNYDFEELEFKLLKDLKKFKFKQTNGESFLTLPIVFS